MEKEKLRNLEVCVDKLREKVFLAAAQPGAINEELMQAWYAVKDKRIYDQRKLYNLKK